MALRKKAQKEETSDPTEFTAVPRAFEPRAKSAKRVRLITTGVIALAAMNPLVLVLSLALSAAPEAESTTAEATMSGTSGVAETAIRDWLAARPTNVPRATGITELLGRVSLKPSESPQPMRFESLTWVGNSSRTASVEVKPGVSEDWTFETHRFMLRVDGTSYEASITLTLDPERGAYVSTVPALTPAPALAPPLAPDLTWTGILPTASVSDAVKSRVNEWAQALLTNDSRRLLEISGDPQNRYYPGVPGMRLVSTPTVEEAHSDAEGLQLLLHVTLVAQHESTGTAHTLSYDVLVNNLTNAVPDVVAWGAHGTGMELTPFENGLVLEQAEEQRLLNTTTTTTEPPEDERPAATDEESAG